MPDAHILGTAIIVHSSGAGKNGVDFSRVDFTDLISFEPTTDHIALRI